MNDCKLRSINLSSKFWRFFKENLELINYNIGITMHVY